MQNMKNIRLCNAVGWSILGTETRKEHTAMKKIYEFAMKKEEGLVYLAGVPAAETRLYWSESPWAAFRALGR